MSTDLERSRPVATEPSEGADPYVAARDYALDEAARERTTARSWRRLAMASLVVSLGLLVNNIVTTAKLRGPAEALVLTQDDRGAMRLLGRAGEAPVPSDVALQAGVRTWLEDVRSIPGIDYALAREQRNTVLAMTDANGPVRTEVDTCAANAAKLGEYEIRAVSSVDVTPLPVSAGAPARTYIVRWAEQTTTTAGVTTAQHSGQVTIANNATIPTDPQVAVLNPAGV
ncbi:MAG: VirB8/TrbF family protein, partial [Solirubrobacteraceae bacterium]